MSIAEKEIAKAGFANDTRFFKKGDEFDVEYLDGTIKYGQNPYGRRYARFGVAILTGELAERFKKDRIYVIAFWADDLERVDIRKILYYKNEDMARTDWEDMKAAIESESPVVWDIIRRRSKTKSVDVIE